MSANAYGFHFLHPRSVSTATPKASLPLSASVPLFIPGVRDFAASCSVVAGINWGVVALRKKQAVQEFRWYESEAWSRSEMEEALRWQNHDLYSSRIVHPLTSRSKQPTAKRKPHASRESSDETDRC
jgi:hypothetical protein